MTFASSGMTDGLSNLWNEFLNSCSQFVLTVWPQHCLLCAAPASARPICDVCYQDLPWLTTTRCPQCALPTLDGRVCGACLSLPPRFDAVCAAFAYAWPLV